MTKSTFVGVINGVEYTDPQEYGAALTEAIQEGKPVDATVRLTPVVDHMEQTLEVGRKCFKGLKPAVTSEFDNKNILNFVDEHDLIPRFDLDALTGDQSHDNDLIDAFMPRLRGERLREIANFITHSGMVAPKNFRSNYLSLLEEAFHKITEQISCNTQALSKLHIERAKLQEKEADIQDKIEELQTELDGVKKEQDELCARLSVCSNADGILKNEAEAYKAIRYYIEGRGVSKSPVNVHTRQVRPQVSIDMDRLRGTGFYKLLQELGIAQ